MIDTDQLDPLAAGFSVLARFHREPPTAEELAGFWELLDQWPLDGTDSASAGLALLGESRDFGESAKTIGTDHAWLYGTMAKARVAPYESVHRGMDGLIFDTHTLEVREAYRSLSLRAPKLNQEPDDHIGLELEFISASCLRALDALDKDSTNEAERFVRFGADFLRDHLLQWAPEMLGRVVDQADTRFMAGLAKLSIGAIESYAQFTGVPVTSSLPT